MKLSELAQEVSGRLVGDGDIEIRSAATLVEAHAGDISYLAMHSYREMVMATSASAVLVVNEIEDCPCAQIVCADPYLAFAHVMRRLYPPAKYAPGISEQAYIGKSKLGKGCTIFPFVYIGDNVTIGNNCVIHPNVTIQDRVTIGNDCIIHPNVSIGSDSNLGDRVILQHGCRIGGDGYGFAKDARGRHLKIPQIGRVVIEDDVEIGANSCVDRATLSATRIGRGTKLDNLVQVGHNVTVGEDSLLVAQVGIAGSSDIGNRVTLAGQVGVSSHLNIGDGATVGGKSGVTRNIPPEEVYTGYPAIPHRIWSRLQKLLQEMLEKEDRS